MKKLIALLICFVCLFTMAACNEEEQSVVTGAETIDTSLFSECDEIRFSSFYTGTEKGLKRYLKQVAPYDDTYTITTGEFTTCDIYDSEGKLLVAVPANSSEDLELKKDQIVYTYTTTNDLVNPFDFKVALKDHVSLFPYDPINIVDGQALLDKGVTGNSTKVEASQTNYKKREGGLYINCNNPEKLSDDCLDKALTRNDVSNQEVFFTFEHNNNISGAFYYGYQVINRGTEDVYITVKNIGYHLSGAGCWLGEKEWIEFYNTKFEIKSVASFTESQKSNYTAYVGFLGNYKDPDNQPITYCLPAGEHIYVMGGTTKDSYQKINVFKTANKKVRGGCSNGAVLFDVVGDNVEAAFYVYNDSEGKNIQPDNTTHQGYVVGDKGQYGRQYVGYDNCHGVVDANLTWVFNDNHKSQNLPITFQKHYEPNASSTGEPYSELNSTYHTMTTTKWYTHINPQQVLYAVGSDMTAYYTVNSEGEEVVFDYNHYDGTGNLSNIGNWMMDYIENYTLVNCGSKDRFVTISIINNGCMAVVVRDTNGYAIEGTAQYTCRLPSSSYGDAVTDIFEYKVKVPANSYIQFSVEYNLLANANGCIEHQAKLI